MFALLDQEKSTSVGIKLAKNTLRGADRWTPGEQLPIIWALNLSWMLYMIMVLKF